jgi:hypothetical protein
MSNGTNVIGKDRIDASVAHHFGSAEPRRNE